MQGFEIGCVYIGPKGVVVLAAPDNQVIYAYRGLLKTKKPKSANGYKRIDIDVDSLCESWGISIERLDEITMSLMPAKTLHKDRTRPWGTGRPKFDDTSYYELRRAKVAETL